MCNCKLFSLPLFQESFIQFCVCVCLCDLLIMFVVTLFLSFKAFLQGVFTESDFFGFSPALRLSLNLSLWYSFSVCCFPFLSFFPEYFYFLSRGFLFLSSDLDAGCTKAGDRDRNSSALRRFLLYNCSSRCSKSWRAENVFKCFSMSFWLGIIWTTIHLSKEIFKLSPFFETFSLKNIFFCFKWRLR